MNDSARGGFRGRGLGALGYLALGLSATAAFLGSLCLGSVSLTFPEVLKALGAKKIRLITNNPSKIKGLSAYGLNVTERVPILMPVLSTNRLYLQTKREKLGHMLAA